MKPCHQCGHLLNRNQKFCAKCGTKTEVSSDSNPSLSQAPHRCVNCHAPMQPNQKFCAKCGTKQPAKAESTQGQHEDVDNTINTGVNTPVNIPTIDTTPSPEVQDAMDMRLNNVNQEVVIPKRKRDNRLIKGPLFVVPHSLEAHWEGIERSIHRSHRGNVLFYGNRNDAREEVRQWLKTNSLKTTMVCLIGSDRELPHDKIPNGLTQVLRGLGTHVLTDLFYGTMVECYSKRDVFTALKDERLLPVSRIPSTDPVLVKRLLSIHEDLPRSWDGGVAIQAEMFAKWSDPVVDHIRKSEKVTQLYFPPSSRGDSASALGSKPKRIYCLVHGGNRSPQWLGHSAHTNQCEPVALHREDVDIAENGIVISQACYGAMTDEQTSIALRFLEQGAGAFIGSTIIAWGSDLDHLCSEQIPAVTFTNLDNGYPLAQALLETKRAIAKRALEIERHACDATVNTLLSFVAYGAPWAKVEFSSKMPRPATLATTPKVREEYQAPDVMNKYRRQVASGGFTKLRRDSMRARLPRTIWDIVDNSYTKLSRVKESSEWDELMAVLASLMEDLGDDVLSESYTVDSKKYAALRLLNQQGTHLALVTINEDGDVLQAAYVLM